MARMRIKGHGMGITDALARVLLPEIQAFSRA